MNPSNTSNTSNIHYDVLYCPIPEDNILKNKLVEEVNIRAKVSFNTKKYMDALLLYKKSYTISETVATLCNLSITNLKLENYTEADRWADLAINKNSNNVKGYYRKGQSCEKLGDYGEAINNYKKVLSFEDGNLAIKKKISDIIKLENTTNKLNNNSNNVRKTYTIKETYIEDTSDSDSDINLRGYRIRNDGTKTTFFNRDLSDEVKKLIGDTKPKKI